MNKRRPLIAGNWKMYHGGASGCELAAQIAAESAKIDFADIVVSPPFTALAAIADTVQGSKVQVAGQNLHQEAEGAFTGEISSGMLIEAGCRWVIIGHSERRQYFGETDALVGQKTRVATAAGLRPIVCLGETLEQREAGQTLEVVLRQLNAFIEELAARPGFGAIAYEPVWAIGTGKVATTEQAQEAHAAIRAALTKRSAALADATCILYGGSVKPDNAASLLACADIDGALVGGASLKSDSFLKIVAGAR